ncbi:hypothetical protein KTD33_09075 [Burkholderia gladioli]|uniref:hypothetical protein n=1 Tax=Burkholderia gladioli TaxID=28095 RepID=UPI001C249C25|nr:hypothetical protein [Burkholderia gladioli]MBU9194686.1 hypothetical protein [Burkholderia gladioli]
MNEDQMRSVLIVGEKEDDQIDQKLEGWRLTPLDADPNFAGGHRQGLKKDGTTIVLDEIAPNVLRTVNVFPHDISGDQDAAKHALMDLMSELNAVGIRNDITASESDLA